MHEIKCPKCHTIFQIDESDYNSIVKQIRDNEFLAEIAKKKQEHEEDLKNQIKLTTTTLENEFQKTLNAKEIQITNLEKELQTKEEQTKNKLEKKYNEEIAQKNLQIKELENQIKNQETESKLAITKAISEKEKEISTLNNQITLNEKEYVLKEKNLKESYENKIKNKDEQIEYYKDFKARQSTKMIGETLEQHCSNEFNRLRPLFKNSYFEKDNDVKTGSKGDFIFRDYDNDGVEIVSIMFEMKNEADKTSTKHKNEDFFKELDKDRQEKKCEYAVLVSLLEIDNDYYNNGIVDVSHKYDKMYVIRPQFFIPLITLIRNLASKSLSYKKELLIVKNQNIDISNFEEKMNTFKEGFARNYKLASDRFKKAIEEIDKTIDHLQKTKENLISSENNLRLANNKADDLSIKKLTANNETMKELFAKSKINN